MAAAKSPTSKKIQRTRASNFFGGFKTATNFGIAYLAALKRQPPISMRLTRTERQDHTVPH